jgi:hypothetical protein
MAALSEWLQLMLAEIARKRETEERAREEDLQRRRETHSLSQDDDAKSRAVLESARS